MTDDRTNPGLLQAIARLLPQGIAARLPTSAALGHRAQRAGLWIIVGFGGQRIIQFASNLILTRLLFPEAFGLMALANVFLIGLAMFSDVGVKPAIIRDARGTDPAFLNTAWTIQAIRGALLTVVACILAYPLSRLYGQPVLFPLLCVVASTAAINGFATIRLATAERDLAFREVTVALVGGQIATAVVMVGFALWFKSVWALAIGNVVGAVLTVALGHWMLKGHRHRLVIERDAAASLLKFGRWIFASTAVTFLGNEGLKAVQAGFLSIGTFGVLALAYSLASIPADLALRLVSGIGLPALAQVHRDSPERFNGALRRFRMRVLASSFVLYAALALIAQPLIALLYDARYHDAGLYLELLLISGMLNTIPQGYLSALLAIGRPGVYFGLMTFLVICRIVGVALGFVYGGVVGILLGISAANLLNIFVSWVTMKRDKLVDIPIDLAALAGTGILFALIFK